MFAAPVLEERPKKAIDHVLIEDSAGHTINCTVNAVSNPSRSRLARILMGLLWVLDNVNRAGLTVYASLVPLVMRAACSS